MNGSQAADVGNVNSSLLFDGCNATLSAWSDSYIAAMTGVYILLGVAGVTGNGMVVLLVSIQRRLRSEAPIILLANVALIELVYFLLGHPIMLWNIITGGEWESDHALCQTQGFIATMLIPLCWVAHALMSVEKYATIATPFRVFFTVKTSLIMVIISWIVCAAFAAIPLAGIGRYEVMSNRMLCFGVLHDFTNPVFIYLHTTLIAGWVISAWCYGGMFLVVNRLRQRATERKACLELVYMAAGSKTQSNEDQGDKPGDVVSHPVRGRSASTMSQLADSFHTAVILFISVIFYTLAFIVTTIAEIVLTVYYPAHPSSCEVQGSPLFIMGNIHVFLVTLILVINPFVYALRNRKIRKCLMKIKLLCFSFLADAAGIEPPSRLPETS